MKLQETFAKFSRSLKAGGDGRNLLAVVTEQFGLRIINFATFAIVARYVDLAQMGILGLAWTTLYFIEALTSGGFMAAAIQHKTSNHRTNSTFFWMCVISALSGWVLMFAAGLLGGILLGDENFKFVASFLGCILFLRMLGGAHHMVFVRQQRQSTLAARTLIASFLSSIIGVYLALSGFGIWAILSRNAAEAALKSALCVCFDFWKPLLCFERGFCRDVVTRALPLLGSAVGKLAVGTTQQVAITSMLGLNVLGGVEVAKRLPMLAKQSVGAIIGRFAVTYFSNRNRNGLNNEALIFFAVRMGLIVVIPPIAILFFLKTELISLIFGHQWAEFSMLFYLLTVWTSASIFISFFNSVLIAYGSFKASTLDFYYMLLSFPLFIGSLFYSVTLAYFIVSAFQIICAAHMFILVRNKMRLSV